MMHLGDYAPGDTIDCLFTTRDATGVPTTLGGTPAVSVYKDNNPAQSVAGVTLTPDFDSLTGLNHLRIVTSDAFYAAGSSFHAVITTGTVGAVDVTGEVVASFSLHRTPHPRLQKNVAVAAFPFVMRSSTTHLPQAGLTVTAERSLDGAAFASCTNPVSAIANGAYTIALTAAELNANVIVLRFTAVGADPTLLVVLTHT